MLYLVKFIYQTFLLPPGSIVILLLGVSFWQYKKKSQKNIKFFIIIAVILYMVSIPIVCDNLSWSLEGRYKPPSDVEGDVIIMLGGGSYANTPNLDWEGHLSGFAANRLLTCVQLYHKLDVPIIISGGQFYKNTRSEAEIARDILLSLDIPEGKIIVEKESLNTTQNAMFTKELVDKHGFSKPILVTSAFHMERSVRQFNKYNVSVTPYPTDYQTNGVKYISYLDFVPSADSLLKFYLAMKEYIGITASGWY